MAALLEYPGRVDDRVSERRSSHELLDRQAELSLISSLLENLHECVRLGRQPGEFKSVGSSPPGLLAEVVIALDFFWCRVAVQYERTESRLNSRNGYREREWDTRVDTLELQIPKLRQNTYFPSLLEPRRRTPRLLLPSVKSSEPLSSAAVQTGVEIGHWINA